MAWRLWDAVGFDGIAVVAAAVAFPLTAMVPAAAELAPLARRTLAASLAAGAGVFLLGSIGLPAFSNGLPERVTFFWHQDADTGAARWLAEGGPLPPAVLHAAPFG
jgi:hypothetical protein